MNSSSELPWVKDLCFPLKVATVLGRFTGFPLACRMLYGPWYGDVPQTTTELLPVWSTLSGCFLPLRASLCIVSARSARAQLGFILRDGVDKARKKDCGIHPQVKTDVRLPSFL